MLEEDKTLDRKERHHITQEDFTPPCVVEQILYMSSEDFTDFSKKILDCSCGVGNLLVSVLRKRLKYCITIDDAIHAIKTIYGIELMADNVEECRNRLYQTILSFFPDIQKDNVKDFNIKAYIRNRIQWGDGLTFDYEHWPSCSPNPRTKHNNVTFHEVKRNGDEYYPMWHEKEVEHIPLDF